LDFIFTADLFGIPTGFQIAGGPYRFGEQFFAINQRCGCELPENRGGSASLPFDRLRTSGSENEHNLTVFSAH